MSFMYLAVEDELSEEVGGKIIKDILGEGVAVKALRKGGFGYLKSKIGNFLEMSRQHPVVMITDLDQETCAPRLRARWFDGLDRPDSFVFRVAVREIESWLLADAYDFAAFLGVKQASIPVDPDALQDPKATLIDIARKASRPLRLDIVPDKGALARQGIGYNRALCQFVREHWNCHRAANRSNSLSRACDRIAQLDLN
jgi:hypothetical protein